MAILGDNSVIHFGIRIVVIFASLFVVIGFYKFITRKFSAFIEHAILLTSSTLSIVTLELTIRFRPADLISFTNGSLMQIFICLPLFCRTRMKIYVFYMISLEILPAIRFILFERQSLIYDAHYPIFNCILIIMLVLGKDKFP